MKKKNNSLLNDVMQAFTDEKELENLSKATVNFYKENFRRYLTFLNVEPEILNPTLDDFNLENFNSYRKKLLNKTKSKKLSDNSYRTYINAIRVFGNWLFTNNYIDEDFYSKIKLPKKEATDVRIMEDHEIIKLFSQFNQKTEVGLRNYLITRIAFELGLRKSSIVTLKISDLNLRNKYSIVWVKGNKHIIINCNDELKIKLRQYIIKFRKSSEDSDLPLFVKSNGLFITENCVGSLYKDLKISTGIKELSCHFLRHNFATNYILEGGDINCLQLLLGHTTKKMTEYYIHLANKIRVTHATVPSMLKKLKIS